MDLKKSVLTFLCMRASRTISPSILLIGFVLTAITIKRNLFCNLMIVFLMAPIMVVLPVKKKSVIIPKKTPH